DLQGRIVFVNGRMCRMLDYAEQELAGMCIEQLVHPEDLDAHRLRMQRLLRRDGSVVWVHHSVTSLPPSDGNEGAVIAVCVDIIERKTTEAALQSSEAHLRMVVENAREYAIFTTDAERRITGWNSGAERILGYSEREALGRVADMIFVAEDRSAGVPQHEAATALVEGRAGDDRFHQRKDGSLFWASGAMMAMKDAEGRHAGFVKILRDQTDARRAQKALEGSQGELLRAVGDKDSALAALEAANAAKDQFLAVLSHELRTPLTPAIMALQLLGRRRDLPGEVHESLQLIHRNIRIESRLIDDLLDLTRISRGTLKLNREEVDLLQIIQCACEVCE
ncbi:MAG: PAS domain S-box protein, partial [Rubrivivax sp.]